MSRAHGVGPGGEGRVHYPRKTEDDAFREGWPLALVLHVAWVPADTVPNFLRRCSLRFLQRLFREQGRRGWKVATRSPFAPPSDSLFPAWHQN